MGNLQLVVRHSVKVSLKYLAWPGLQGYHHDGGGAMSDASKLNDLVMKRATMNARCSRAVFCVVLFTAVWQPTWVRSEDPSDSVVVIVTGQPQRVWQDDSGYYSVRGKLVGIGEQVVRLLKENQRLTTVPLDRLSEPDRAYVSSIHVVLKPSLPSGPLLHGPEDAFRIADPPVSKSKHVIASVTLSREFLNRFVQNVDRTQPLATTILGVPIRGWAHTTASANLVLIPNVTKAVLEIPIRGQVASQTVGNVSVARVHSQSLTDFEKSVRVNLTETGVLVEPKELSTINRFIKSSVSTSARALSGLVTRIAKRRVQASKPAADQIAQQQERQRINRVFEATAKDNVERLNRMMREFLETNGDLPLVRDSRLGFSTTEAVLRLAVTTDAPPPTLPAPPETEPNVHLVVQLHSSVFVRASQSDAATEMTSRLQQLAEGESSALETVRQHIETGKFATRWSEDEAWLTITWRPEEESTDISRPEDLTQVR
ncbi:MAG TPA: SHD1 domain-containing protein [Pirellulaceae bacterium]|nr:SHD1 domain-containing protein [Pirellulaceae bacterium]